MSRYATAPRFSLLSTSAILLFSSVSGLTASADDTLMPLELSQVKVGGEIGRRIDVTVHNNLLLLDTEKDFLAPFRKKKASAGYIALGKLIDAAVRFAAYTKDENVLALKKRLVAELIETQEPDGYIGQLAAPHRMSAMWDVHEMVYIIFGLTSDYHYFQEKPSLEAARNAADYIIEHWSTIPADLPKQTRIGTHLLVTGLERAMLALHRETGEQRYVDFCINQRDLAEWNMRIVVGRRELLEGHIYSNIVRILAQLELYRLQPQEGLLSSSRRALRFLTAEDGMAITGEAGQSEIWTTDQDVRGELGETCATAYQIRLYDNLLRMEGTTVYGDIMERTIFNGLFAAQSPDGRHIRYYTPLEGNRLYHRGDTWCCPGNYRRIVANLPAMVYYRSAAGVVVNLYTPSEATVDLAGGVSLTVRQETDYPSTGRVVFHLNPSQPANFAFEMRIPRWCGKAAATVNDRPLEQSITPGTFLTIDRQWSPGDQVTLDMPMTWRLVLGRKRQSGRVAVMRGPMVFCFNPAPIESLRDLDAADLTALLIDAASLKELSGDNAVRPGGVACQVRAGTRGFGIGVRGNLLFKLSEVSDPDGKSVYFSVPDLSVAVADELVGAVGDGK